MKIYPNPSNTEIYVELVNSGTFQIRIVNSIGSEVYYQANYNSNQSINVRNLSKGIYFVQISNQNGQSTKKLIIE